MLYDDVKNFSNTLRDFRAYPSISDRYAWEHVNEAWKEETIKAGEKFLGHSYAVLTATDFMEYSRTGNRVNFENKYFEKRRALNALVLAECVEDKGRFLDSIVNGIFSICEESAWQLPSHNSYIRDTPSYNLPDVTAPVLDLFACETGALLATVFYLLGERLEAVSTFIPKRILHEIDTRILRPYLETHFWWMGDGAEALNNWTIWCTQNVLITAFLVPDRLQIRKEIVRKACKSIDYYLQEYAIDGCCDEGAQYYRHAGLCLMNAMEILNAVTDGGIAVWYEDEKIKNIAAYIMNVHVGGEYYLNFADCSPIAGRAGSREYLFAKRTGNAAMMKFAAKEYVDGALDTLLQSQEINLFYRLQNAFLVNEIYDLYNNKQETVEYPDIYYPSVGIFIARDTKYFLAVKAGSNTGCHGHNDTGSFIIYKENKPLFIDVGVESYTQKTFSDKRYEIWTMQSAYHNLPTFNGEMQQNGIRFEAHDVHTRMEDSYCEIQMNLEKTYGTEANLLSYERTVGLKKGVGITLKEQYAFQKDNPQTHVENTVVLSFMTYEKPVAVSADKGMNLRIGDLGNLYASNGKLIAIEEIPITDERLGIAWKHEIYRILIEVHEQDVEFTIV